MPIVEEGAYQQPAITQEGIDVRARHRVNKVGQKQIASK